MLSKTVVKARPSVLWCYKKELYLSSHKKKRMKQIKKMAQVGRRPQRPSAAPCAGSAGRGAVLGKTAKEARTLILPPVATLWP